MRKLLLILVLGMFLLVPTLSASWTASLETDLVSWYKLDRATGDVIDSHGSNDGTNYGATRDVAGIIKKSFDFNGSGNYVNTNFSSKSLIDDGDFSLQAWIYVPTGDFQAFGNVFHDFNGTRGYYFTDNSPGGMDFTIFGTTTDILKSNGVLTPDNWHQVVAVRNSTSMAIYIDGVLNNVREGGGGHMSGTNTNLTIGRSSSSPGGSYKGKIDEAGIWTRALNSSEVSQLYNGGSGITYPSAGANIDIELISPSNNSIISSQDINFTINSTAGDYNLTNVTYNVWYNNGTLFNETTLEITGDTYNETTLLIEDFLLGEYLWGGTSCQGNGNGTNCTTSSNYSFTIGAVVNSINYQNYTYETKNELFSAIFDIVEDSEISLAQLEYNGTNYTINNLTQSNSTLTLYKNIDIPLNVGPLANQTNEFKFRFTYGGGFVQETGVYEQNSSFINFQQCDGTYDTQALNFTFYDEINQTNIDATTNPTNLESNWEYWVGAGTVKKTYTLQNLGSSLNNYQLCIFPYLPSNYTFRVGGDIEYSADNFRKNEYHLNNATVTNSSNDILLYLMHTSEATKFFLTFKKGVELMSDATVTVQKYFTGLGEYQTVSILTTDADGKSTMWQEVDKEYKYFVVRDGVLEGTSERESICSVAPCTLTIILDEAGANLFESYYEAYAQNVVSTLTFDQDTKIVTYTFVDTTGLANYFRLIVNELRYNSTGEEVCNKQSFSTAGTLTCNLTGYSGEFVATSYISRSPEVVDLILNFITDDDLLDTLGLMGIFLIMCLIITIVFSAAVIGRGSPSVVLIFLALSILILKLIGLFPFTWTVVVTLEIILMYIISKVKT